MKTVIMDRFRRLTLPVAVRRLLGLEGETEVEVEVDEAAGTIVLRPTIGSPREDAWAYTPEHRALLDRAREDSREGRVRRMSEDDLARLVE